MAYDVSIRRYLPEGLLDLRSVDGDAGRLFSAAGIAIPARPNSYTVKDDRHCLWLGPNHWVILLANTGVTAAKIAEAAAYFTNVSLVDLTDAYEAFEVTGPEAQDVLAQATPLNLNPEALSKDLASFTYFFGRRAILLFDGEAQTFRVFIERSYGDYIAACLKTAHSGVD